MTHISEQDLLLYHYGEAAGADSIAAHLQECAACQREYQTLRRVLDAVDTAPVPERPQAYGTEVWKRLHPLLTETRPSRPAFVDVTRRWVAVAALAASLILAFTLGRYWPSGVPEPAVEMTQESGASETVRERIVFVALGDHLEKTQMMLVELVNAEGNGTVDIGPQQRRAADLISDNRLYRLAAERAGDVSATEVLEELERILIAVAHSDGELPASEFEALRERIDRQGIILKVRVIESEARDRSTDITGDSLSGAI